MISTFMEMCSYSTLYKFGNGALAGWYRRMGQYIILAHGCELLLHDLVTLELKAILLDSFFVSPSCVKYRLSLQGGKLDEEPQTYQIIYLREKNKGYQRSMLRNLSFTFALSFHELDPQYNNHPRSQVIWKYEGSWAGLIIGTCAPRDKQK